MRARGLKRGSMLKIVREDLVAPHAGAWIETGWCLTGRARSRVAPHAGAWIETKTSRHFRPVARVAPHAGAWIETSRHLSAPGSNASRPMRARGLKQRAVWLAGYGRGVAPHAGAWIETWLSWRPDSRAGVAPCGRVD